MKNQIFFLITLLSFYTTQGQVKPDFRPPMDIPLILSGNFGELRSNHFHSGIDIKTQGVTGFPVYAIEKGYVSRIKVQPGGYGKAIYLAHPGGYTSVYGHLAAYNPEIDDYIRSEQYRRKSHSVDLYLNAGELEVDKGEIIAYSGNTGSSSGPHLHFEVRRTADQHPLNTLLFGFPVKDRIKPVFKRIGIYPLGSNSHVRNSYEPHFIEIQGADGEFKVDQGNPIPVFGKIGFGTEIYDYLDGARNRCGIYSLELFVDGNRLYYSEMDEFSFGESRFINAHIDYRQKVRNRYSIQKLFRLPYNELSIYKYLENGGVIEILDTLTHEVKILATDSYGNKSSLSFVIKGNQKPLQMVPEIYSENKIIPFNAASGVRERNLRIDFPAYCVYEDIAFRFSRTNGRDDILSDVFYIHDEEVPVHKHFDLALEPEIFPEGQESRLCIVSIDDEGETSFAGGTYNDGWVETKVRDFGRYAVAIDTTIPSLEPLNLYPGKDVTGQESIRFLVKDDLSGIDSYEGFIDQNWVLFQYDPKNDLLFYEFDDRVPISKKNHELEMRIKDAKGNLKIYNTNFYR